ncbi:MAG: STAS domain-containing protein [Chromatiaceae bacterium]|nr:STAS domain-containing protein [Chromatiaceae bacterium]
MPPNIHTSTQGSTLTVRLSGPLDRRIASSLFSRFLSAKSRYDDLIVDITGVDEVSDAGLAALRLLRTRARQAGKRLAVVDCHPDDRLMRARQAGKRLAVVDCHPDDRLMRPLRPLGAAPARPAPRHAPDGARLLQRTGGVFTEPW